MEKIGLNDIRDKFRDFFVSKGHYSGGSASLIPKNDKSLLIINSGMAPLKPYFSGAETPPCKRMTTCQKCIRTGDIDNVGKTARHGTFFEMLGNFSFGDYFKKESLTWGWEFVTEILKMPKEKIWASIYEKDEEAHDIWIALGMPEERIVRLGKDDNFWEIGLGPCGPCSEMYYDRGPEFGCGDPNCKPGCECDRYIEFWNHVFTQFSREEGGSYSDLAHPNIDTGMGLERVSCIMQDVDSIFDIDTIRHILDAVCMMADCSYESGNDDIDLSVRIITDHMRSITFMIADGILPSNEGRGYVLRRLLRRAYRHGKLLGIEGEFLHKLVDKVVDVSGGAYPEIAEKQEYIKKMIWIEEEKFNRTLDQGLDILNSYAERIQKEGGGVLKGEDAFRLYDTYGFPIELTEEILKERGIDVDEEGFNANMQHQKEMARTGRKSTEGEAWKDFSDYNKLSVTEFVGYSSMSCKAKVLYSGDYDGKHRMLVFDKTPFYATSGGQVADTGVVISGDREIKIVDVIKENGIFIHVADEKNSRDAKAVAEGSSVELRIDVVRRHKTAKGHSATHLLQKALKVILGNHVMQAGSYVDDNYLRFDFNHFKGMSEEEIKKVEDLVNNEIDAFLPINIREMPIGEAKKLGAEAIFGEKYGDIVRVVKMGDFSLEFCGGTHLDNTGKIGAFKIINESGIASGIRRIEAVVGTNVIQYLNAKEALILEASNAMKTREADMVHRAAQLVVENKALEKEIKILKKVELNDVLSDVLAAQKNIFGINLVAAKFEDADADQLRALSDEIKSKQDNTVAVLAGTGGGKVVFIVSVTDDLVSKGYNAGKIIKEVAKAAGGGGGGKAGMAQAGAKDSSRIEDAFAKAEEIVTKHL